MYVTALLCVLGALPGPSGTKPPPAASAPATAPAGGRPAAARKTTRPPDMLTGAVDPYQPAAERRRFFRAAGVDNELDVKEFASSRARADSFVRRFDRIETMLAFDKDRNRRLDWFEADAYRQDVRRRVLKAFDANGDGRLTGAEREKANAMLATGRIPGSSAGVRAARGGGDEMPEWMRQRMRRQGEDYRRRFDADHDGSLTEAERRAMLDAVRREAEEEMRRFRERRFDADGDGRLSDTERRAMEEEIAAERLAAERAQHERDLRMFDADGDGQLSDEEIARMEAEKSRREAQARQWVAEWERRQYDLNRDGQIDDEERLLIEAARARREVYERQQARGPAPEDRRRWEETVRQWRLRHFDVDDDGELSEAEQADARAFERELGSIGREMRQRSMDLDGDGEVTDQERAAVREEWRKAGWKVFTRVFRYMDADGDGQISYTERQGFQQRIRAGMVRYIESWTERYDANRNGRLDPPERRALLEGARRDFADRVARYDVNRDGRLSVDETIELMEGFAREIGLRPVVPEDDRDRPVP